MVSSAKKLHIKQFFSGISGCFYVNMHKMIFYCTNIETQAFGDLFVIHILFYKGDNFIFSAG